MTSMPRKCRRRPRTPALGAARPYPGRMTDPIAAIYDDFGRRWAHDTSPLYEDWATGIAADPACSTSCMGSPRRSSSRT